MPLPNRSTISDFDGDNKINNQNLVPANQQTDWDNTKLGPCTGDVAALGLTAPRFWCRMTLAASTGALVLNTWHAQWENVTTTTPILSRSTTGVFSITLPTMVSDEYDASLGTNNNITLNLLAADASAEGTTALFINASASGNVIIINSFNISGIANDNTGVTIFVRAF